MLDFRLVFIPAFFILLRMWTCITNILFTYIGVNPEKLSKQNVQLRGASLALIILSVSCLAHLHYHSASIVLCCHISTLYY